MTNKDLKVGVFIQKEGHGDNDKLTYLSTITIANQPIIILKDKYNKEVRLNKFELRSYFVVR